MAENKKSFLMYCDWAETFEALPDEKAGQLIKHILQYVNDKNPKTDDVLINAVFINIKNQLKRDLLKYEKRADTSRENGKLGGRPKKPKKTQENPMGFLGNPDEPRKPDIVTDTVIVIDIDKETVFNQWLNYRKEIKKPIKVKSTLESLIKTFNQTDLKKCEWVVKNSIDNSYQGLFWDNYKEKKEGPSSNPMSFLTVN